MIESSSQNAAGSGHGRTSLLKLQSWRLTYCLTAWFRAIACTSSSFKLLLGIDKRNKFDKKGYKFINWYNCSVEHPNQRSGSPKKLWKALLSHKGQPVPKNWFWFSVKKWFKLKLSSLRFCVEIVPYSFPIAAREMCWTVGEERAKIILRATHKPGRVEF